MDEEMLSSVLDNDNSYEIAINQIFISDIMQVFNQLLSLGDTKLISFPEYIENDEFIKQDCNRFSFIGNNSSYYFSIVFEENKITVTDVYDAWYSGGNYIDSDFFKRFALSNQTETNILVDSTIDFLIKAQKCKDAINEICSDEIIFLHKEIYINWLNKYDNLKDEKYSFYFFPYPRLEKFNNLFYSLSRYKYFLDYTADCIKANEAFRAIEVSNEDELIKWLINVEELGDKIHSIIETSLNKDENEDEFQTGYITAHENFKIKISITDFKDVLEFTDHFFSHYWRTYYKYCEMYETEINNNLTEGFEVSAAGKSLYELVNNKK
jgi:hypothetical protein